jgi:hypothetical protein
MTNENNSDAPSADATGQPPRQPPVIPPAPPQGEVGPNPTDRPNNEQETARELAREFRWVEGAQLVVNGVLAIVGIIALCIYGGQLKVMRGQLGEIIRQFPEIQKSANANVKAADQTEKAVKNAAVDFRLDQRAWIGIDFPILNAVRGADKKQITVTIQASIKNTGKTPALKMSLPRPISVNKLVNQPINYDKEWETSISDKKQKAATSKKMLKSDKTSVIAGVIESFIDADEMRWNAEGWALAPGSTVPISLATGTTLPDPNLDPRYQDIRGAQAIFWIGRITYRDIFSNEVHTTKFCLWYFSTTLELCPGGNSMD